MKTKTGFFRKIYFENKKYILEIYKYSINLFNNDGVLKNYTRKDVIKDYISKNDVSDVMQTELLATSEHKTQTDLYNQSVDWKRINGKKHEISKFDFTILQNLECGRRKTQI